VENFWLSFGSRRILGRPDIATLFAALGVYQILRGQLFGSAASLLFYALVMRQLAATEQASALGWAAAGRGARSGNNGARRDAGPGADVLATASNLEEAASELSS
jgi:hypothetical protein